MKFTDIAWDFDGTLYNSYSHIVACIQAAIGTFGVTDTKENILKHARVTVGHALQQYAPLCGCDRETLFSLYRRAEQGLSDSVFPYGEAESILKAVADSGRRNHLCSNRSVALSRDYLKRDGLLRYFTVISGPDALPQGLKSKPAPDLISYIHAEQGISPMQLLMVGDRWLDVQGAHAAGSPGCFFDPDGASATPPDADFYAHDWGHLQEILLS